VPGARWETPFVVLSAVFWAGLLAAAQVGRERLSEPTSGVDLVALGLAGAKIGRIVAFDRVTVFLRRPFAGGPAAVQPARDGMRRAIGELVTCPHFVSVYQLHLVDAPRPVEESVGEHELARARATADVVSVKKRYSLVVRRRASRRPGRLPPARVSRRRPAPGPRRLSSPRACDDEAGLLLHARAADPMTRWRARLPETYEEYPRARSAKTRSNVKRYTRRLKDRYGEGAVLRVFQSPADLPQLVEDTAAVFEKTYQRALGVGQAHAEAEPALQRLAAERRWLRAFNLYLDGVPRGFWHGTLYRRVFYTGPTGYDPEYRDLRRGTYMLAKMAERLCGQADRLDFGLGDAEYKRHLGDQSWEEDDVLIFARRPRPVAVNLTRSGVLAACGPGGRRSPRADTSVPCAGWRARLAGRPE
jgi:Acetyltransferase (GNAT) domain/Protein of unknown function (DUF1360)